MKLTAKQTGVTPQSQPQKAVKRETAQQRSKKQEERYRQRVD